jgi:threonine/homoserine/homoserine lactone efflux protein
MAVAFGVAGLLASSIVAFTALKYVGAAYLVYLGIARIRRRRTEPVVETGRSRAGLAAFVESFVVGVTNPKSVLFFLAFLPQFVDPSRGNPLVQILVLWLLSQVMAVVVGSAYALAASWLRRLCTFRRALSGAGNFLAGSVYIGLGLAAALAGSRSK